MANTISPWRLAAASALLLTITALSPAQNAAAETLDPEVKKQVIERMGAIITGSAFVPGLDFSTWPQFLDKKKEALEKAMNETEFAEAINADLSKFFGISHIVLITPKAAKARLERKTVGIGIQVQPEEEGLRVVGVFPDTPAADAGLEPGDLVLEADGKKVTGVPSMLGEEGTEVVIKVRRNDGSVKEFKLVRRKYSNVRPDTLTWLDADTAMVKVHTFDLAYDRRKVDEIMSEAFKAKKVILDLRSNGGGNVLNMLHLLGFFIPSDEKLGTFVGRSMVDQFVAETGGKPTELRAIANWAERGALRPSRSPIGIYKGHVAVLVNGGTGSASEITAAALKEFRGAPIVGTKTAGAVLVSVMSRLHDSGWTLQYPLMDYVSRNGARLEGEGIVPDVEAPTPRFREADTAVEKALALLKRLELRDERAAKPPPPEQLLAPAA